MKTAIATVSIAGDLAEKLSAIAEAGFDGVEIFENDFLAFDRSPKEVGQMVRDHGLEISLFQPFRDFEGMPEPQRTRTFARADRKFDLMREMGADLVLICSNVSPIALGGIDRAAEDLHELGEMAKDRGIRIGYEALAWGRFISDHRDAWEIVRRADHANVGLILDTFHTLSRKIEPDTIRAIPGDKIFFVQLADAPNFDMDLLYWSRHFRNMPGEGDLDVTGFMRAIAATGYDGVLSLEIFNDQFRGGSPKSIAVDGYRSLLYLMDQVRRVEPDIKIPVPEMPERVAVEGIEFVEFAADRKEAGELSAMLTALGFQKAGQHVSKAVELWRQGDINIVINTDPKGFAHSSYLAHGTNVCDIGLKVADAGATVRRAESLGAKIFEQPVGPGELRIPAIRALGGSVLHFIDSGSELSRVWDIEFKPAGGEAATTAAGLTRIDHIAETMNYDEMLTWLLFYRSIFDTDKTAMVDVIDPAGLVRSQVIENADGSLRITLNGAENRKTLAGHFISEGFGSGVQHLAFATDDIFRTVEALKANGFTPLVISPNYYDDLDARFGLEEEFLNALKSSGILYDRDDQGEYFQLYSPTYGEGFFFEIVERRGGYKGYGAANAQFRIAAQKRHFRAKGVPAR
ncbi:bifunctional sugar phosphate isomerase/epimerase/4-hydroxyphenylpyruvate dioxygenase family protein [Roseibium aggregatum]|uniref:3-dehydroshikimate dehydratase n=1 Tax=Roseibium aggregatum TaxID=187304 RepID=A0A939J6P8_9HYPH|nr:bifunctional sugar phosphate isomerase/epimerase/4-hydroxyphenylpyruvate dioxygenase family protein [Roseibium aggregatum]MBN9673515.1 bifunctional sugar phosphate isomerase/epimerase/4-hydroxyphenylpyruvate dioxygenase family protein [Roseibium aggregatum]